MAEGLREIELKEKKREEKRKPQDEKKQRQRQDSAQAAKKWKGKDWFVIFSPSLFGSRVIGETPATNPKTLMGRNIEVSLSDLIDKPGKDFSRVVFSVNRIEKKAAYTRFNGYVTLKEHVMRMVRKRTEKVQSVIYVETKDKWRLQVTSVAILNRNTESSVTKKVRSGMEKMLSDTVASVTLDDFLKSIISTGIQKDIKKFGNKIYPVRFYEIEKIEVKGVPELSE